MAAGGSLNAGEATVGFTWQELVAAVFEQGTLTLVPPVNYVSLTIPNFDGRGPLSAEFYGNDLAVASGHISAGSITSVYVTFDGSEILLFNFGTPLGSIADVNGILDAAAGAHTQDSLVEAFSAFLFVDSTVFQGSGDAELIRGSDDVPMTINASDGHDTIYAGTQATYIDGQGGNDQIFGSDFGDTLIGSGGFDTIHAGGGADYIVGTYGGGGLYGEAGDDTIDGQSGDESIFGGSGSDYINGGGGADTIDGGGDNDTIYGAAGEDVIDGGDGYDLLDFSLEGGPNPVVVTFTGQGTGTATDSFGDTDTFEGIESLRGTELADSITGSDFAEALAGAGGNDTVVGGDGADTLVGGAGGDHLSGGNGADWVDYGLETGATVGALVNLSATGIEIAESTVAIGSGRARDTSGPAASAADLDTLDSIENVAGSSLADFVLGSTGANRVLGRGGNDTIYGGVGADTLDGGAGDDELHTVAHAAFGLPEEDNDADVIVASGGHDTLYLFDHLEDLIDVRAFGIESFEELEPMLSGGGDALITFNANDSLEIMGTPPGALSAANFIFSPSGGGPTMPGSITIYGGVNTFGYTWEALLIAAFADGLLSSSAPQQATLSIDNYQGTGDDLVLIFNGSNIAVGVSPDRFTAGTFDEIILTLGQNVISVNYDTVEGSYANANAVIDLLDGSPTQQAILDAIAELVYVEPTIVFGSADGETIYGSNEFFTTIEGNGGNDSIVGGDAGGTIDGGTGNDTILGGLASDTIYGGDNNDSILGGGGADELHGDDGNDTIFGDAGADSINGATGNDVLYGGADNDTISGDSDDDILVGGEGDDEIHGGDHVDRDELNYLADGGASGVTVTVTDWGQGTATDSHGDTDTFDGIEYVRGTDMADTMTGAAADVDVQFSGEGGNDLLEGNSGHDYFDPGAGTDTVLAGGGSDTILGSSGNESVDGGSGYDVLTFEFLNDPTDDVGIAFTNAGQGAGTVNGFIHDNIVNPAVMATFEGIEAVVGSQYDDLIYANEGSATDDSHRVYFNEDNSGNDEHKVIVVVGNAGDDDITDGNTRALLFIDYEQEQQNNPDMTPDGVIVNLDNIDHSGVEAAKARDTYGDMDFVGGTRAFALTQVDDEFYGNSSNLSFAYYVEGGNGDDTIVGGNSGINGDNLQGDGGDDSIHGNGGRDHLEGGDGDDTVTAGDGYVWDLQNNDIEGAWMNGGRGNDVITGGTGGNYIVISAGQDSIDGGAGQDQLAFQHENQTDSVLQFVFNANGTGTINGTFDSSETELEDKTVDNATFTSIERFRGTTGADTFLALPGVTEPADGQGFRLDDGDNDGGNDEHHGFVVVGGAGDDLFSDQSGADYGVFYIDYRDERWTHSDYNGNHDWGSIAGNGEHGVVVNLSGSPLTNITFDLNDGTPGDTVSVGAGRALDTFGDLDYVDGVHAFRLTDAADMFIGNNAQNFVQGRAGNDTITGGTGRDNLQGQEGNDSITGAGGADQLEGGDGDDTLTAGAGEPPQEDGWVQGSYLNAGRGKDLVTGGTGGDYIVGGSTEGGVETVHGGGGSDQIVFEESHDGNTILVTFSAGGTGTITGIFDDHGGEPDEAINVYFTGLERIRGTDGADSFAGGVGASSTSDGDTWYLEDGTNGGGSEHHLFAVTGGAGADTFIDANNRQNAFLMVDYREEQWTHNGQDGDPWGVDAGEHGVFVNASSENIEDFAYFDVNGNGGGVLFDIEAGKAFDTHGAFDTISGVRFFNLTEDHDVFFGGEGPFHVRAQGGNDSIYAGSGNDNLDAGEGNDYVDAGDGNNYVEGGDGNDTIYGGAGDWNNLSGNDGDDKIYGGSADNELNGGWGNDTIYGGDRHDGVDGWTGDDEIYTGHGNDFINGSAGFDTVEGGYEWDKLGYEGFRESNDSIQVTINGLAGGGSGFVEGTIHIETNEQSAGLEEHQLVAYFKELEEISGTGGADTFTLTSTGTATADGGWAFSDRRDVQGGDRVFVVTGGGGADSFIDQSADGRLLVSYFEERWTHDGYNGDHEWGEETGEHGVVVNATNGNFNGLVFNLNNGGPTNDSINVTANHVYDTFGQLDSINGVRAFSLTSTNDAFYGADAGYFVEGRDGDDVLVSGNGADQLLGDGGNDMLSAGGGADVLRGDWGDDSIYGMAGNDDIDGGDDNDYFVGGAGNDTIRGGNGYDTVDYSDGDEGGGTGVVVNLSGARKVEGVDFTNAAHAGAVVGPHSAIDTFGNIDQLYDIEKIVGSLQNDTLIGYGDRRTEFEGGRGNDTFIGGNASDVVIYGNARAAVNINLATGTVTRQTNATVPGSGGTDTLISIEDAVGSSFADTITGSAGNNALNGLAGNDTLVAGGGIDTIVYGFDTWSGGTQGVTVNLTSLATTAAAGGGNVAAGTARDGWNNTDSFSNSTLAAGQASDRDAIERVLGSLAADKILAGANTGLTMFGLSGNDTLTGGAKVNDTLGAGGDWADYSQDSDFGGNNRVWVNLNTTTQMTLGGATIAAGTARDGFGNTDTLTNIENARGGDGDDFFGGSNSVANRFEGGGGQDLFWAGDSGNDTLDGGDGTDLVDYSSTSAAVTVNLLTGVATSTATGTDTIISIGEVIGTNAADNFTGTNGGTWYDNGFWGLGGADTITGNGGYDIAFYNLDDSKGGAAAGAAGGALGIIANLDGTSGAGHSGDGVAANRIRDGFGNLDVVSGIEGVRGTNFADVFWGNPLETNANNWQGSGGSDTIHGTVAFDIADYTQDYRDGGNAHGIVATLGTVDGNEGLSGTIIDSFGGTLAGTDAVDGIDMVRGTSEDDSFSGAAGANVDIFFEGLAGDDTIDGNNGAYIFADYGDDHMYGGDGGVFVDLAGGFAYDSFRDNDGNSGRDTLLEVRNVRGSAFDDAIITSSAGNTVFSGDGNDFVLGSLGTDSINGGSGWFDQVSFKQADSAAGLTISLNGANGSGVITGTATIDGTTGSVNTSFSGIEHITGSKGDDHFTVTGAFAATPDYGIAFNDFLGSGLTLGAPIDVTGGDGADTFTDSSGATRGRLLVSYNEEKFTHEYQEGEYSHVWGTRADEYGVLVNLSGTAKTEGGGADFFFPGRSGVTVETNTAIDTHGDVDTFVNVKQFWLTDAADILWGGSNDEFAHGGRGADYMDGGLGNDLLVGGHGSDTLLGGGGTDTLAYTLDRYDEWSTGHGVVVNLQAGTAVDDFGYTDQVSGFEVVVGTQYADTITGSDAQSETLVGAGGDDSLNGGGANDQLRGGAGYDTLNGGSGSDTVDYNEGTTDNSNFPFQGDDNPRNFGAIVNLSGTTQFGVATLTARDTFGYTDTLVSIENANGSEFDDTLVGGTGVNTLFGAAGNDLLIGTGNDDLDGGLGANTIQAGAGDTVHAASGDDTIVVRTGAGDLRIEGFTAGGTNDRIDLTAFTSFSTLAQVVAAATNTVDGVVITLVPGGTPTTVTLVGIADKNSLTAADFVFAAITGTGLITGTANPDLINGSAAVDTINGLAGNDTINGLDQNDQIRGDQGDDVLNGGAGADTILGGNATLTTGTGNDTLDGGTGIDSMAGGDGNDTYIVDTLSDIVNETIAGSGGVDTVIYALTGSGPFTITAGTNIERITALDGFTASMSGGAAVVDNVITGNAQANTLVGGGSTAAGDTLVGGGGDDVYIVDTLTDTITEAVDGGRDRIESSVVTGFSLSSIANVEDLTITAGTVATGNSLDNVITGNASANTLEGGASTLGDTLIGLAGNDTYNVDSTTDTIVEAASGGTDLVVSSVDFSLALIAEVENLTLIGGARIGTGNTLANTITGTAFADTLSAGSDTAIDVLIGGDGNDTYYARSNDTITETVVGGTSIDTVIYELTAATTITAGTNIENITVLDGFTAVLNGIVGGTVDNVITGNAQANTLSGGGSTAAGDTLIGGGGDDVYIVDTTTDTITEAEPGGTDRIESSISFSLAAIANVENLTITGGTVATGNSLDNVITGNANANTLDGGASVNGDTLVGLAGNDTYNVDSTTDTIVEAALGGTDTVVSSVSFSLAAIAEVENLTLTGSASVGTGNILLNTITGTAGANTLSAGSDTFVDILIGGDGNDTYFVRTNDTVTETVVGATSIDTVIYELTAASTITAGTNIENISVLDGFTAVLNGIVGGTVDNIITGNAQANTLNGGGSSAAGDTLIGGGGDDVYIVDTITDTITEATSGGTDRVESSVSFSLAAIAEVENLTLLTGAITGTGNSLNNVLTGNAAANTLTGLGGDDTYNVAANDTVVEAEGGGNDTIVLTATAATTTTIANFIENFTLLGAFTGNIIGNDENNIITGSSLNDTLNGGIGNDTLVGNAGADQLDGGTGDDSMVGGDGNDIYVVDSINDTVVETSSLAAGGAADEVRSTLTTTTLGDNVENLLLLTGALNGVGNGLNNVITGNAGANSLSGGGGNDSLVGNAGNDTLDGGTNTTAGDTMIGGANDDTYVVDSALDVVNESTLLAGAGIDTVISSINYSLVASTTVVGTVENLTLLAGAATALNGIGNASTNTITGNEFGNSLSGGDANDTLYGNGGDDTLVGGLGADSMIGGEGSDTYEVDNASDEIVETGTGINDIDTVRATLGAGQSINVSLYGGIEAIILAGTNASNATGDSGNNVFTGNSAANVFTGLGGDDTYNIGVGDTVVEAAAGGIDSIVYTPGTTTLTMTIADNVERFTLNSATVAGNITGNAENNTIIGGGGADTLNAVGGGADVLTGGLGNDTYFIDSLDTITTDAGGTADTVRWTGNAGQTFTLAEGLETLFLDGTANTGAVGNSAANSITGNAAANTIDGGAGSDTMAGGLGNDVYYADVGGAAGVNGDRTTEAANAGTDTVIYTGAAGTLFTLEINVENLTLAGTNATNGTGNTSNNILTGNSAANTLKGLGGNDTLVGDDGADILIGGAGNDTYVVGTGDTINESLDSGAGIDTVQSSITFGLAANGTTIIGSFENLTLTGSNAINGSGNELANTVIGNSAANNLMGLLGDDTLIGGIGEDTLQGGVGHDVLFGGTGGVGFKKDTFYFESGDFAGALADSSDDIFDYSGSGGDGDVILLNMGGANGLNNGTVGTFIMATQSGGDVLIGLNESMVDGSVVPGIDWSTAFTIHDVSDPTSVIFQFGGKTWQLDNALVFHETA